jgi:CPA2 family monovalent cation:H+ antiporter-2
VESSSVLPQLLAVVGVGIVAALLLARLRLPAVAGFLLAGALTGPHGFGLIHDSAGILHIAEIGVVLLLFTLGVEFSGERLRRLGRIVLGGGLLQVLLTVAVVYGVGLALSLPGGSALYYGFIFALSSTAIVLRLYQQSGELDAPHGRFVVGTLLFQDIAVVLFMLLTPLLSGGDDDNAWLGFALVLAKAAVLLGFAFFASRYLIGWLLRVVDRTGSRELFLLTTLLICLGTAQLSAYAGLSLALGAFLAGVVMASSGFGHRALGEILPIRDLLASVFFITLGMLFDSTVLFDSPLKVALLLLAFTGGKAILASLAAIITGYPARVAWLAGMGLAQFGEFGFVLVSAGMASGLVRQPDGSALLAAGILSMMLAPLLIRIAPRLRAVERLLRPFERYKRARREVSEVQLSDHVIVAGYGPGGKLLARVLRAAEIPYIVYDLNADAVLAGKHAGMEVRYGDIAHPETIEHSRAADARAVVVMFNDGGALPRAIEALHRHAPGVPVMARCRYLAEAGELHDIGADVVVVEELETGLSMLRRVLRHLGHSGSDIARQIAAMRAEMQPETEGQA